MRFAIFKNSKRIFPRTPTTSRVHLISFGICNFTTDYDMDEACSTHMSNKTNARNYSQENSCAKTTMSTYTEN